jgi:hypothetical protein
VDTTETTLLRATPFPSILTFFFLSISLDQNHPIKTNVVFAQSRSDAHNYSQSKSESTQHRNGYGSPSSPVNANFASRSRSPHSHSHPKDTNGYSADPASPTNKALNLTTSPSRHRPTQEPPTRHTPTPAASMSSILNPEPAAAPASAPAAPSSVSPKAFSHLLVAHGKCMDYHSPRHAAHFSFLTTYSTDITSIL